MKLVKWIYFSCGKPCMNDGTAQAKFHRFAYWFYVVFGIVFVLLLLGKTLFEVIFIRGTNVAELAYIPLAPVVWMVYSLLFRFVYWSNLKMHGLMREK